MRYCLRAIFATAEEFLLPLWSIFIFIGDEESRGRPDIENGMGRRSVVSNMTSLE